MSWRRARRRRPKTSRSSFATPAAPATTSRLALAEAPPHTTWQVVRPSIATRRSSSSTRSSPASHAAAGQRSSLWLTAEEHQSLMPADPKEGQTYKIASKLAKRICLYGLWPQTLWVVEHAWQPDAMREGELNLTVEDVSPQIVRMR